MRALYLLLFKRMPHYSKLALVSCGLFVLLAGCTQDLTDPNAIIERAKAAHGSELLEHAVIEFDFRDKHYRATRDGGRFMNERIYEDSTGSVREVLTNDDLFQEINGVRQADAEDEVPPYLSSLNSVIYFALLPMNLTDPAVRSNYLGTVEIKGKPYYKVEVTFVQEDGGIDYDDRFIYWFNKETFIMEYLAYGFHVNDGGIRMREAINPRRLGGALFSDYLNFKSERLPEPGDSIEIYDSLLDTEDIELLSTIELENLSITPIATQ